MEKFVDRYFELLLRFFEYDISVYTEELWIYYWMLIPAIFYTAFFMVKWTILTAPMWLPIRMIIRSVKD